jgi:hypothetical protein
MPSKPTVLFEQIEKEKVNKVFRLLLVTFSKIFENRDAFEKD